MISWSEEPPGRSTVLLVPYIAGVVFEFPKRAGHSPRKVLIE